MEVPSDLGGQAASYEVCEEHEDYPLGHPLGLISGDPLLSPGEYNNGKIYKEAGQFVDKVLPQVVQSKSCQSTKLSWCHM